MFCLSLADETSERRSIQNGNNVNIIIQNQERKGSKTSRSLGRDSSLPDERNITDKPTPTPTVHTDAPTASPTASPTPLQTASPTPLQTASPTPLQTASPTKAGASSSASSTTAKPTPSPAGQSITPAVGAQSTGVTVPLIATGLGAFLIGGIVATHKYVNKQNNAIQNSPSLDDSEVVTESNV